MMMNRKFFYTSKGRVIGLLLLALTLNGDLLAEENKHQVRLAIPRSYVRAFVGPEVCLVPAGKLFEESVGKTHSVNPHEDLGTPGWWIAESPRSVGLGSYHALFLPTGYMGGPEPIGVSRIPIGTITIKGDLTKILDLPTMASMEVRVQFADGKNTLQREGGAVEVTGQGKDWKGYRDYIPLFPDIQANGLKKGRWRYVVSGRTYRFSFVKRDGEKTFLAEKLITAADVIAGILDLSEEKRK